eukprot:TRINITY_DN15020_c0_g1_i1.p1 TRINITY_DN15020_c0_g1~~TRINITY_DN15020_c0_g1_i1.p1  ORF type:complete len:397 (-),score=66.72 TRINITY_DN15020_c0_g1_i1:651-1841(-)
MASTKLLVLAVLVASSIGASVFAEEPASQSIWDKLRASIMSRPEGEGSEPSTLDKVFAAVVESVSLSKVPSEDGHGLGPFMESLARGMSSKQPSRWHSPQLLKLVYPFGGTTNEGGPREKVCETCQAVTLELSMVLNDPDTPKQAEELIETYVCASLQGDQAKKCKDLVEMYVPELIAQLQTQITPELCVQFGLCGKHSPFTASTPPIFGAGSRCDRCLTTARSFSGVLKEHAPNWEDARTILHAKCLKTGNGFSQDKCHKAVDEHTDEVMEVVDALSPAQMCRAAGLCRRSFGGRDLHAPVCGTCHFLVMEAKMELHKPENQQKVLNFMEATCQKLRGHEDECVDMVKQYGPLVFVNIDNILDARVLCNQIGACPEKIESKGNVDILRRSSSSAF